MVKIDNKKCLEFSFDDGVKEDLRIAKLLKKYNQKAVFYISDAYGITDSEIKQLYDMGMEIGGHTVNHFQDLKILSDIKLKYEINENKRRLESIIKEKITKFCYPRGRYNARVMNAVMAAGYIEARTTLVLHTEIGGFNKHTTIHFYPRKEYKGKDVFEIAKKYVKDYQEGEVIRLWGHSLELINCGYLKKFEDLLIFINTYKRNN